MRSKENHLIPRICLALALLTALCYWPMTGHRFVGYDDQQYFSDNPQVRSGLTWAGIAWAFTTGYYCSWHPLTWISHMADCQLYGLNPGGHHFTNLLFHVANTLLLFLLLRRLTGRLWPSAFVAALFAWHPLHVESLAWASERKDVLSAFFFLLTLGAYAKYSESRVTKNTSPLENTEHASRFTFHVSRSSIFYALTLFLFALALMSKPMVVTLPFVLLLLDFWPLGRFQLNTGNWKLKTVLLREKLPFFALSLAASIITFLVQQQGGATSSLQAIPLGARITNALVAYASYIGKTVCPADLSPFYPLSSHLQPGLVVAAAFLLLTLSAFFISRARTQPFLIFGWLWFLGTLVPVIGLVQAGAQSMADRYMYIPSIGLFIVFVWGLDAVPAYWPRQRQVVAGIGALSLMSALVLTGIQLKYWRDSLTLFGHAVEVMPSNYLAQDGLGKAFDDLGRKQEALSCFRTAVRLAPHFPAAQYNLGTLLMEEGKLDDAITHFKAALEINPNFPDAHYSLGNALFLVRMLPEAREQLSAAAELKPEDAGVHYSLGTVLLTQSRLNGAVLELSEALRLNPRHAEAHRNLGVALMRQDKPAAAIIHFSEAARLEPANPEMRFNYGLALLEQNQPAAAVSQLAETVRLRPEDVAAHYRLAAALALQNRTNEAISQYREALRLRPNFPEALNELARLSQSSQLPHDPF